MKTQKKIKEWQPPKTNKEELIKNIKEFISKEIIKTTRKLGKENNYEELIDTLIDLYK